MVYFFLYIWMLISCVVIGLFIKVIRSAVFILVVNINTVVCVQKLWSDILTRITQSGAIDAVEEGPLSERG